MGRPPIHYARNLRLCRPGDTKSTQVFVGRDKGIIPQGSVASSQRPAQKTPCPPTIAIASRQSHINYRHNTNPDHSRTCRIEWERHEMVQISRFWPKFHHNRQRFGSYPNRRSCLMNADRPVDNAPYQSFTHGGLTVEGWSRAAVQSYWRVPELKIGFDLGAQPWDFMGTPTWFVSHTHLDHIAALPVYVARRRMMKMEPPTVYLSRTESLEDVRKLMLIMHRLDRGRQFAELEGAHGRRGDRARPRACGHGVQHRRTPSPVGRFRGLGAAQQAQGRISRACRATKSSDLRLSGVADHEGSAVPARGLHRRYRSGRPRQLSGGFEAKMLITEMSFIRASHRRDKIHKFGHMHLDDFVERADRFKNELIIAPTSAPAITPMKCGSCSTTSSLPN